MDEEAIHYGITRHLEQNRLEVIIYKHKVYDDKDPEAEVYYQLTSIQICKLIEPRVLVEFVKDSENFPEIVDRLEKEPYEKFYLVRLKQKSDMSLEVIDIKNVSNSKKEIYFLH